MPVEIKLSITVTDDKPVVTINVWCLEESINYLHTNGTSTFMKAISYVIDSTAAENNNTSKWSKFKSAHPVDISMFDYVTRFCEWGLYNDNENIYILLTEPLILLLRFSLQIDLYDLTKHRIFAAAFLVASKFYSDDFFNNEYIALVAGIPNKELNDLEAEFLFRISFNLNISPREHGVYFDYILKIIALIENEPQLVSHYTP